MKISFLVSVCRDEVAMSSIGEPAPPPHMPFYSVAFWSVRLWSEGRLINNEVQF